MDIEKLIERLRTESIYADKASLEIMDLCMESATALSTLQAENESLKEKLYDGEGVNLVDYWMQQAKIEENGHRNCQAENERLRETVDKYATAARVIALHLKPFCDESLPYDEMIADAARKASDELEQVKRVLAMMWYAYENKDREAPHEYEIEARRAADKVLGPWAECMPKYLRNSQESSLCDTCAHPFDEVCKGCSDGDRYEPKAPADPAQAMDEITEFTRDQWDWLMGRFTRKED